MSLYEKNEILAGVVLYNPQIARLAENLSALVEQVDEIILVDNASTNLDEIKLLLKKYEKVNLMTLKKNYGIAHALNSILHYAKLHSIKWVLTMDQDSVADRNLISHYLRWSNLPNVAMITCKIQDRNTDCIASGNDSLSYERINKCITSGCFTNVDFCLNVGGFDEKLFIDYVDYELCIRLRKSGYQIVRLDYFGLLHEVGHAKRVRILGHNLKIAGNYIDVYNEPSLRIYYFFRNTTYIVKKYGKDSKGYTSIPHIIWRAFLVVCFEKPRLLKTKMILKGIFDGIKMPI